MKKISVIATTILLVAGCFLALHTFSNIEAKAASTFDPAICNGEPEDLGRADLKRCVSYYRGIQAEGIPTITKVVIIPSSSGLSIDQIQAINTILLNNLPSFIHLQVEPEGF